MRKEQCLERVRIEPMFITVKELSILLAKSVSSLYEMRARGTLLDPVKLDGSTRWNIHEVKLWIADGCPPAHVWRERKAEAAKIQAALHPCPN